VQVNVWYWDNPNTSEFYFGFFQRLANHHESFASREGIGDVVAVLGAADGYDRFIGFLQNVPY
jgi:hypothetical protein